MLTTEYPPFFGGGISTYSAITAGMLNDAGHQVSVFVNDAAISETKITQESGIRLIRFNPSASGSSAFLGHATSLSYEFAHILRIFIEREGKPDLIESQEYLGIAYYLLQFKQLKYEWCAEIPIVITMHSPSFLYLEYNHAPVFNYPNFWIGEMERSSMISADLLISPSRYLVDQVRGRYMELPQEVSIIPNPFKAGRPGSTPGDGMLHNKEIIFYGKLSPQKGTFKLLEYFSRRWSQGNVQKICLIGDQEIFYHPESRTMGDLIRRRYAGQISKGLLSLERKIDPSLMNSRLDKAAVVIIPSTVDNFPYVVLEMMALGRIVLVSAQGGQREIVQDGLNGFVFDHDLPGNFDERLDYILHLSDHERNMVMRNAVESVLKNYNTERIYGLKYDAIKRMLEKKGEVKMETYRFIRTPSRNAGLDGTTVPGLLSIVVPYYNLGKYLKQTIMSLQKSAYKKTEIIIVNDGSTLPSSIRVLNECRSMVGVRIIDVANAGLAAARNLGASEAKGEYMAFLDADDTIEPEYHSRAVSVLEKLKNVHFVGSWTRFFDGSRKVWPGFTPEPPLILSHNLINSSALVYRRDSFIEAGLNSTDMPFQGLEDYDSVIAMISKGYTGVVLPEIFFNYRVRPDSMIRDVSRSKKLSLMSWITQKHQNYYSKFASGIVNLTNTNGPGVDLDNPSLDIQYAPRLDFGGQVSRKLILLVKGNKHARKVAFKLYRLIKK